MARQVGNCACTVRGNVRFPSQYCSIHASAPPVHSAPTAVIATIGAGGGEATVDLVHEPATERAGS